MTKSYYDILNVSKDSTDEQIKKAYKNLAKIYHPDNQETGDAEKMSEINRAYEGIKTKEARELYNRESSKFSFKNNNPFDVHVNFNKANSRSKEDIEKIFKAFGKDYSFKNREHLSDVIANLDITLEEAYTGISRNLDIRLSNGVVRSVQVNVPAGINNGDKIIFKGQGIEFNQNISDLFVKINIQPHSYFIRDKNNLLATIKINSIDAMLGTEIELHTLLGKILNVKIPAGIQYGQVLKVSKQGMPILNTNEFGDILLTIQIETVKLTNEQKKLFQELK